MLRKSEPPAHLTEKAKEWWGKLSAEYDLGDSAAQLLLAQCLTAFDRANEARQILRREGITTRDKSGKVRAHPAAAIERDAQKTMAQALRDLHLDLEPLADRPGRQPGDRGRNHAFQTPPSLARMQ